MRPWTVAVAFALLAALIVPAASADQCEQEGPDCNPGNGGPDAGAEGNRQGPNATGNETGPARSEAQGEADRRKAEREGREAQGWAAYRGGQGQAARMEEERALRSAVPPEVRESLGLLVQQDGAFTGTYIAFDSDPALGILQQVARDGTPLFDSVYMPLGLGETAQMQAWGNQFQVSGDDWTFHLKDHTTTTMFFRTTEGDPFLLVLPVDATVHQRPNGVQIAYGAGDDALVATLRGDVAQDAEEPGVLHVDGKASFHVSAPRTILPQVSNRVLADLEAAIAEGSVGGEMTVLRAADAIFEDTVLYEELDVALEDQTPPGGAPTYTITIDSASQTGKTIAVNFEDGLLDPATLAFEYFNVEADKTTEAPIRQAASLQDVLDPLDDGTVAEYWVIEDADGVQVLLSIPHFSVHQIRLTSLVEAIIEQPSLVIGTVGAALLVGAATVGVFRRPEDDV